MVDGPGMTMSWSSLASPVPTLANAGSFSIAPSEEGGFEIRVEMAVELSRRVVPSVLRRLVERRVVRKELECFVEHVVTQGRRGEGGERGTGPPPEGEGGGGGE